MKNRSKTIKKKTVEKCERKYVISKFHRYKVGSQVLEYYVRGFESTQHVEKAYLFDTLDDAVEFVKHNGLHEYSINPVDVTIDRTKGTLV